MSAGSRGTIFLEEGRVLQQTAFEAGQFVIRIEAPQCAVHATPGSFAHLTCHETLPMRRPLSLMRADARAGWVEILYKTEGAGLHALSRARPGESLSILGPIGHGFTPHPERPRAVLIGGGVGIPPVIFLAEHLLARRDAAWQPLAFMGSEVPFPFRAGSARSGLAGIAAEVNASMPLLEEWGVASRLASRSGFAGCFAGFVTELAQAWLQMLAPQELAEVEIFACGPTPMLAATADLARRHGVACQVALEEYMACAVGGCAGCTVLVETAAGPAMKRVCVDGPVFDAYAVFPGKS
ncbi:MAG TPA: dihydroorotate dehydrogenase electron transfer subunit [Steroidobacteraceae bacterium]|nr:dihydroorotate dehydrogenase electron transfer subunit [Steroidobacteraceae bacterium]